MSWRRMLLVYHRQPGCGQGRPSATLGSREHRPAPRPDRPPPHPRRPRRGVRRVLRCRGRGLRAPRPRTRGHRGRLGAAQLRPRDRQHRGVRRRTAGRCRRGDHGWAARRGRRPAGRARTRDRVVAGGVDRAAGDLARVLAGRPGGTGRVAPPAPAAGSRLHPGTHLVGARAARGSRDPAAVPPRRPHPRHRGHGRARARRLRRHPGRVRRVGGAGAGDLRGLGGDHRAPPR